MTIRSRYQWAFPSEWLADKIESCTQSELSSIAYDLLRLTAEDDLQDAFQHEMELDGYFEPRKGE